MVAQTKLTQAEARAICEAGYMPLCEYLRICQENGWAAKQCDFLPIPGWRRLPSGLTVR